MESSRAQSHSSQAVVECVDIPLEKVADWLIRRLFITNQWPLQLKTLQSSLKQAYAQLPQDIRSEFARISNTVLTETRTEKGSFSDTSKLITCNASPDGFAPFASIFLASKHIIVLYQQHLPKELEKNWLGNYVNKTVSHLMKIQNADKFMIPMECFQLCSNLLSFEIPILRKKIASSLQQTNEYTRKVGELTKGFDGSRKRWERFIASLSIPSTKDAELNLDWIESFPTCDTPNDIVIKNLEKFSISQEFEKSQQMFWFNINELLLSFCENLKTKTLDDACTFYSEYISFTNPNFSKLGLLENLQQIKSLSIEKLQRELKRLRDHHASLRASNNSTESSHIDWNIEVESTGNEGNPALQDSTGSSIVSQTVTEQDSESSSGGIDWSLLTVESTGDSKLQSMADFMDVNANQTISWNDINDVKVNPIDLTGLVNPANRMKFITDIHELLAFFTQRCNELNSFSSSTYSMNPSSHQSSLLFSTMFAFAPSSISNQSTEKLTFLKECASQILSELDNRSFLHWMDCLTNEIYLQRQYDTEAKMRNSLIKIGNNIRTLEKRNTNLHRDLEEDQRKLNECVYLAQEYRKLLAKSLSETLNLDVRINASFGGK